MDGVVKIDLFNNYEYYLIYIGKARIWKVDYSIHNRKVALITTAQGIICILHQGHWKRRGRGV